MPSNWSEQWVPKIQQTVAKADALAPKDTPFKKQAGVDFNTQEQINQQIQQYDTGKALRQFQKQNALESVQRNLSVIDRSMLDQYKNVSNDYAARGMLRTGGYLGASDKVTATGNEQASGALSDLLNTLSQGSYADTQSQQSAQQAILALAAQYAANQAGNKTAQTARTN